MDTSRPLIVTHHAPDFDAVSAVWLLKRFDAQHFADAKVGFVNPGEKMALADAEVFGSQLHEITYVDTGFGQFDHHQPDRAMQKICAASLVFDYICESYPDKKNDPSLLAIIKLVTQVDHFEEITWPEPQSERYLFMLHEIIRGHEYTDPHNDDSQLHFGFQCLDNVYATLTQYYKALDIIQTKGQEVELKAGKALVILTSNDDVIKVGQKQGYLMVVKKDPKLGNIRVKVRPDAPLDLVELHKKVVVADKKGTWFLHGSHKMLLNGSQKSRDQVPSPLTLEQMVVLIKEFYG
jgi:hypothetical protein